MGRRHEADRTREERKYRVLCLNRNDSERKLTDKKTKSSRQQVQFSTDYDAASVIRHLLHLFDSDCLRDRGSSSSLPSIPLTIN